MTRFIAGAVLVLATLVGASADAGEGTGKAAKTVASGIGLDAERAARNALRNAVERAVQELVSTETMLEKGQLLNEEILRRSSEFVNDPRMVAQETGDDGLVHVKMEMQVRYDELQKRLRQLALPLGNEREQRSAGAATGIDTQTDVERLIAGYPQKAFGYFIGKPEVESVDPATGRAKALIPVTIKWDEQFTKELRGLLARTAARRLSGVDLYEFREGEHRKLAKESRIICLNDKHPNRTGKADDCFVFPAAGGDTSDWPQSFLGLLALKKTITVSLYFKDKSGKLVESVNYEFVGKDQETGKKQKPQTASKVGLLLRSGSFDPPNILWRETETNILYLLRDEVFSLNANVDMDSAGLKDLTNIEVNMSNVGLGSQ